MGASEAPAGDLSGVFRRAGGSSEGDGAGVGDSKTDEMVNELAQDFASRWIVCVWSFLQGGVHTSPSERR